MFGSIAVSFDEYSTDSDNEDTRLYRRNVRDATNVLDIPEERFIAYFRVNKEVFVMLLTEIAPKMKVTYRSTHIPSPIKLATFLTFLVTGGYQASIGNECISSMSKSQVSKTISELLDIFEEHLCAKWIKLEKNLEEENKVKESFYNSAGIRGVIGCVDGTHVRIKSPGDDVKHLYYNRKGFYSMNVMLICDHNMVIIYVDARHPGANHDAFVWDQSAADHYFRTNYLKGKRNTWLLGDSGYKLQPYLMTPYRNPTETREKKFNEKHCKIRNVIERCNGVLKNRFRCIIGARGLHYSPEKTTKIVNACCTLHNISIFYKNYWLLSDIENGEDNSGVGEEYNTSDASYEESDIDRCRTPLLEYASLQNRVSEIGLIQSLPQNRSSLLARNPYATTNMGNILNNGWTIL